MSGRSTDAVHAITAAREQILRLFTATAGHVVWIHWSRRRLTGYIHVPPARGDYVDALVNAMAAQAAAVGYESGERG